MVTVDIRVGDARALLAAMPSASVHCIVTSPPYFGLRDYGVDGQMGLEPTLAEYIAGMVGLFREARRVLRDDGTLWCNIGDSYATGTSASRNPSSTTGPAVPASWAGRSQPIRVGTPLGLKTKDLMMVPARLAIALQDDGWFLRSQMPWIKRSCLSGGTRVYARTQKGEMPMTIKDMVRLDPSTVQLWNGEKWTQVIDWWPSERPETTYEIELRTGQRIGCTGDHLWPTQRGNVKASELRAGGGLWPADVIKTCRLPEPPAPARPSALDDDLIGWFVGLYIAEGCRSGDGVAIASHVKEEARFDRLRLVADAYHGRCWLGRKKGNACSFQMAGPAVVALVEMYVSGDLAAGKHLGPRCWERSDQFLRAVLDGYLSGDGHWDAVNKRWRLGFCNNDELVADLRTLCARLGVPVRLRRVTHKLGDKEFPGYRGEIRFDRAAHSVRGGFAAKADGEVVAVRQSRARRFWDIHVEDEPHLYALASGVLTHNCMPESVTDRPTSAIEYVFLLTKRPSYFWDAEAVKVAGAIKAGTRAAKGSNVRSDLKDVNGRPPEYWEYTGTRNFRNSDLFFSSLEAPHGLITDADGNPVALDVNTAAFKESHFAVFPLKLIEPLIKAGTSERGCCPACGAPWVRMVEKARTFESGSGRAGNLPSGKNGAALQGGGETGDIRRGPVVHSTTTGWQPSCGCPPAEPVPCTVLDPFGGAGTTAVVAQRLGRDAILLELNPDYAAMAERRLQADRGELPIEGVGLFAGVGAR